MAARPVPAHYAGSLGIAWNAAAMQTALDSCATLTPHLRFTKTSPYSQYGTQTPGFVGGAYNLAAGQPNFTVELWVRVNPSFASTDINLVGSSSYTPASTALAGWHLRYIAGGSIRFYVGTTGGTYSAWEDVAYPSDGRWHHIQAVRSGPGNTSTDLTVYIDGVEGSSSQ